MFCFVIVVTGEQEHEEVNLTVCRRVRHRKQLFNEEIINKKIAIAKSNYFNHKLKR